MYEIKYALPPVKGGDFMKGCGEDETFGHGRPHFQSQQAVVVLKKKAQALTQGSTSTGFWIAHTDVITL